MRKVDWVNVSLRMAVKFEDGETMSVSKSFENVAEAITYLTSRATGFEFKKKK